VNIIEKETPIGNLIYNPRSPITNKYYPDIDDAKYPIAELRELEMEFNKIFSIYTKLYYSNNAICSVYICELGSQPKDGFIVAILIKNEAEKEKCLETGAWDSVNFISVTFGQRDGKNSVTYKLTTTIILNMSFVHKHFSQLNWSGSFTRQVRVF
jgi:capping protein beta